MQDSTFFLNVADISANDQITLPIDSAFIGGERHLGLYNEKSISKTETFRDKSQLSGSVIPDILTMLFIILGIASLRRIINLVPSLVGCIIRWKENTNLEDSTKLCLSRDYIYYILLIPFCLILYRFRIYNPEFLSDIPDFYRFLCTTGIFLIFLFLRQIMQKFIRFGKISEKNFGTAANSFKTYFVILVTLLLISLGILELADLPEIISKTVLTYEIISIYLLFIFRKTQIFINSCSLLSGILYLCALEFLPTGILVASAIVL